MAAAFALGACAGKNGGMADERESKELQSGTLVIGLGRFGSAVAVTQDQLGYEILAVEKNPARVQAFAGRFPLVEADATSIVPSRGAARERCEGEAWASHLSAWARCGDDRCW